MRASYSNMLSILRIPTALTFSTSQLMSTFVCLSSLPNYTIPIKTIFKKKKNYISKEKQLKDNNVPYFLIPYQYSALCTIYVDSTIHTMNNYGGLGLPWWLLKNPPANAGVTGLIPGSGRSPREGNGNPLQFSCLGSPMDGGTWWATGHEVTKSRTQLSN